jgi:hypothetical protein
MTTRPWSTSTTCWKLATSLSTRTTNQSRFPAEKRHVLTAAIQPPRLHCSVYDRHTTLNRHRTTLFPTLSLASTPSLCHHRTKQCPQHKTATMNLGHYSREQRPAAREATNPWHHRFHRLWHVCRKTSVVYSISITTPTPGVPVHHPRNVAPRHQSNSEAGGSAFRVARHTERLSHLGTGFPSVPTLQNLPPHYYSTRRFHTNTSPFSTCQHRPLQTASNVSRIHILSHCNWPLHTMARSHSYPGHHSRHCGTHSLDRLDIPFRLPRDDHHRRGTSVWVPTLLLRGQIMWYPTFSHDRLSPCRERTRREITPDVERRTLPSYLMLTKIRQKHFPRPLGHPHII